MNWGASCAGFCEGARRKAGPFGFWGGGLRRPQEKSPALRRGPGPFPSGNPSGGLEVRPFQGCVLLQGLPPDLSQEDPQAVLPPPAAPGAGTPPPEGVVPGVPLHQLFLWHLEELPSQGGVGELLPQGRLRLPGELDSERNWRGSTARPENLFFAPSCPRLLRLEVAPLFQPLCRLPPNKDRMLGLCGPAGPRWAGRYPPRKPFPPQNPPRGEKPSRGPALSYRLCFRSSSQAQISAMP